MKSPVFAVCAVLLGACSASPGQNSVVVKQPQQHPLAVPSESEQGFAARLKQAQQSTEQAGWVSREVIRIPGKRAAIILYDPSADRAPATRLTRYEAIAETGPLLSGQSGLVDVVKTRGGSFLWDLRGDGGQSVVLNLTPCGVHCGQAKATVFELIGTGFAVPPSMPSCPSCIQDQDRDHVPEFTYRMFALQIAPCSRASCGPAGALEVEVRGIESWDAGHFARNLRDFIPMYFDRLREAHQVARRVRSAKAKSKTCPLNALRVASELYVYGRLIGEKREAALRSADRAMKGYSFKPCAKEYDLLKPPKDWDELRRLILEQELPRLEVRRQGRSGKQGSGTGAP